MNSMRLRLLVLLLAVMVVGEVLVAALSFGLVRHEVDELFDAEQARHAKVMRALIISVLGDAPHSPHVLSRIQSAINGQWPALMVNDQVRRRHDEDERLATGHRYERKLAFQWVEAGQVVLRSDNAPQQAPMSRSPGYAEIRYDGHVWHIFTLRDAGQERWLTIAERDDVREEMVREITLLNLKPFLLFSPLLMLGILWVLRRGMSPLDELACLIRSRDRDNLEPLQMMSPPREIQPIVASLNALLNQLRHSLEAERRFTSLASHELRTPVAVAKLAIQNAALETDVARRNELMKDAESGVDRVGRLTTQLLTLARIEQDTHGFEVRSLDLPTVCREVVAATFPLADARHQTIELDAPDSLEIQGVPQLIPLLVRNLVENAIKYTPEGGRIELRIDKGMTGIRLSVADSGPGIPVAHRRRVFDRFVRLSPQDGNGSGLGLPLVKRIAEIHHTDVMLESDERLGGLRVDVLFPALTAASGAAV